ncbi:hypothetical protein BKA58DRAFT_151486 [Alternaria rosae]|uniref:uncharacterized protein n=1 Tax=Alternaria rosae TaxID=1187941 RepID=UPI001E8DB78E|nr:uncharacterized protein BKA58DRAFT_151486 [Alternaria rosae]KAH6872737.1 hypothetical protein BKA58DRAFT_151486 [Alternaria rosae]
MLSKIRTFVLFACVQACTANLISQEGPFGITMHPTSITASRVNSSGLIEVYTCKPSPGYVQYLEAAARCFGPQDTNDIYPDADTISMFRNAFAPVTEDLIRTLGHPPKCFALLHPATFNIALQARCLGSVISSA